MITAQPFFNYTTFCPELFTPLFVPSAQYVSATISVQPFFNHTSFCPEAFTPLFMSEARYLFLEDHLIGGVYFQAGITAVADGIIIPLNWIPTPNVDPLNIPAVNAFYAAGPQDQGLIRTQLVNLPVSTPVTYWIQISPNVWALTGLGSDRTTYRPISKQVGHPLWR